MKRIILSLAALLVVGIATVGALGVQTQQASAAAAPPQCNGEMNVGGYQVACTISIVNYIGANGQLAGTPPSSMVMTRCVGAAGPVSTLTCTTTVTTLSAPITSVSQCNYSGNGGGANVRCSVDIVNHFIESPGIVLAASVYQCVGSVITGPGAPGTCTPANTAGVTSATQATVGQCNDSGNGGTNVAFICSVSVGSTMAIAFPININQCNNSGNGGGAVVQCSASVSNQVIPPPTPTDVPPVTEIPTEAPTLVPGTTPTIVPPTPLVPGTTPQAQNPPTIVPPTPLVPGTTPQAQNPPTEVPPTPLVPGTTPQPQVPPSSTPGAPATGETGPLQGGGTSPIIWVLGLMVASVGLAGLYRTTRVKNDSQR